MKWSRLAAAWLSCLALCAASCAPKPAAPAPPDTKAPDAIAKAGPDAEEKARINAMLAEFAAEARKAKKDEEEPFTDWTGIGETTSLGGVWIRIDEAYVGKAESEDGRESVDDHLVVRLVVMNRSQTRKMDYAPVIGRAEDEFGNWYKGVLSFDRPKGAAKIGSLYPGKQITDVLLYERPVEKATRIDIQMPGKGYGEKGTFRFRLQLADAKKK